jgi:trehalose 6-phosphate phosphatase
MQKRLPSHKECDATRQNFTAGWNDAATSAVHLDMESSLPPLGPGLAFFLDVDGTLLELAPTPDAVHADPGLLEMLETLRRASGGALALLSGRRLDDLDRIFSPLSLPAAGIHGLERRRADGTIESMAADAVAELREPLAAFAAQNQGLQLEDKGLALALHYRGAPHREAAARAFARALAARSSATLRLLEGKMVIEFHARDADKGRAIEAFMAEPPFRGRRPVFAGDDVTDEDGFRAVRRLGGIAIRIGDLGASAAEWRLPSVTALRAWLQAAALETARNRPAGTAP